MRAEIAGMQPNGDRQLFEIYKQVSCQIKHSQVRTPLDEMRLPPIRVSDNWERCTSFFQAPGFVQIAHKIWEA